MKWVKLGEIMELKRRKKGVSLEKLFQTFGSKRLYLFKKKKGKIYYLGYVEKGNNNNIDDNLKFDYVGIKKQTTDLVDDDYLHYLLLFLFQDENQKGGKEDGS